MNIQESADAPVLDKEERGVICSLAAAWNTYVTLDPLHTSARKEFESAVHRAMHIIMSRPVQRQFNLMDEQ